MIGDEDLDQNEEPVPDELQEAATAGGSGPLAFVGGLVIGALLGAGIALLVAPARGEVMRRRIKRRLRAARRRAGAGLDDLQGDVRRELRRRRRQLERGLHRAGS